MSCLDHPPMVPFGDVRPARRGLTRSAADRPGALVRPGRGPRLGQRLDLAAQGITHRFLPISEGTNSLVKTVTCWPLAITTSCHIQARQKSYSAGAAPGWGAHSIRMGQVDLPKVGNHGGGSPPLATAGARRIHPMPDDDRASDGAKMAEKRIYSGRRMSPTRRSHGYVNSKGTARVCHRSG
jgi:hypothetical protein